MKKLTKKKKAELWNKMEWEGGLAATIEHGGIFDIVKGTVLEEPLFKLQKALLEANEAIEAQDLESAALELSEES
jgi:hypothetical protein